MDDKQNTVMDRPVAVMPEPEYDKLFRNSAFGGFNKQDVLSYIERTAKNRRRETERYTEHVKGVEAEKAALSKQLSDLQEKLEGLPTQDTLDEITVRASRLEEERDEGMRELARVMESLQDVKKALQDEQTRAAQLAGQQEAATAETVQLKKELSDIRDTLQEREEELARVRSAVLSVPSATPVDAQGEDWPARCAMLEDKLRAYEREKLRIHEIEDEAYRRARRIEEEAAKKARRLEDDMRAFEERLLGELEGVGGQLDGVRSAYQVMYEEGQMRCDEMDDMVNKLADAVRTLRPELL